MSTAEAFRRLEVTPYFEYPPMMVVNEAAVSVCAFQRLLDSENAEDLFLELAQDAVPAGRAYALAGLSYLSSPRFSEARVLVEPVADDRFEARSADEYGGRSISEVAMEIERMGLAQKLATAYKGKRPW